MCGQRVVLVDMAEVFEFCVYTFLWFLVVVPLLVRTVHVFAFESNVFRCDREDETVSLKVLVQCLHDLFLAIV